MAKENDATFVLNVPEQEAAAMASPQWQSIANFDATIVPASHKKLLRSMAHAKGNQISVFPEDIRIIPGFNPRLPTPEFQAHIREIADSIKEHGFYEDKPLAGFAGMDGTKPVFFLTDGEVRYRAALPPARRTPDGEYARRLEGCRRCENLDNGTCMACGCYVEMRAARLDMHCPLTRAVW